MTAASRRIAMLVSACVVASGLCACSSSASTDGPLTGPAGTGWVENFDVGDTFTNGYVYLQNTSRSAVTIEDVTPVLEGSAVEYLGARQLDETRKWPYFQYVMGWPRSDGAKDEIFDLGEIPVMGSVERTMLPGELRVMAGANLLLGFKAVESGKTFMKGVTVSYSQDGRTWSENFDWQMLACVDMKHRCSADDR